MMTYYIHKILNIAFGDAVARSIDALTTEGLGILIDIDFKETLNKKIGVEFPNFRILGTYNPTLAFEGLKLENKVGTMLPCNLVVRDAGNGQTEVATIDPVASMQAIENTDLKNAAAKVRDKLKRVIAAL